MTPSSLLCFVSLAALLPGTVLAQSQPEDEWQQIPGTPTTPPLPTTPAPAPAPSRPPLASPPGFVPPPMAQPSPAEVRARLRPREAPNDVSMFGAPALGQWKRGQAFVLGFPFIQLKAAIGVLDDLDIGLSYESFYLMHHEVRGSVKYGFGKGPGWAFALAFEGGGAFFNQRASREARGTRWLTGRRNLNFAPGAIISYQGSTLRAARLFLDLRYMLTVDTEPFAQTPLQGVPATFLIGHNALSRAGGEFPLSERTSFLFSFGLDLHFRPDDAPAMVNVAIGLVTGF
jgi:hypothetical protein